MMLNFRQLWRLAPVLILLGVAVAGARPALAAPRIHPGAAGIGARIRPSLLPVGSVAWLARTVRACQSELGTLPSICFHGAGKFLARGRQELVAVLPLRAPFHHRRRLLASRGASLKNACSVDCHPQPIRGALRDYLLLVRHLVAPSTQVTSTFYEPRPGGRLHDGYDIGFQAGTGVPAGWSGRVTRLTHWGGPEYGISVQVGRIQVTYGHLVPTVQVGQFVQPGDIVGRVAYNHVDMKMLDADHNFVDWGVRNPFPRWTRAVHISQSVCGVVDVRPHLSRRPSLSRSRRG